MWAELNLNWNVKKFLNENCTTVTKKWVEKIYHTCFRTREIFQQLSFAATIYEASGLLCLKLAVITLGKQASIAAAGSSKSNAAGARCVTVTPLSAASVNQCLTKHHALSYRAAARYFAHLPNRPKCSGDRIRSNVCTVRRYSSVKAAFLTTRSKRHV